MNKVSILKQFDFEEEYQYFLEENPDKVDSSSFWHYLDTCWPDTYVQLERFGHPQNIVADWLKARSEQS